ncbi:MAG: hypothetical protein REI78_04305 [Pedobacter sp.]|nr:hypothetical protein [Pedobacter sp.]
MDRQELELFRQEFSEYYDDHVVVTDLDSMGNMVVYTSPYKSFDEVILYLCEHLPYTIHFDDHLDIYLYQFGTNGCIRLGIN